MNVIIYLIAITGIIEGVVLDPALYLSPSPPLTSLSNNDAEKMWTESINSQRKYKGSSVPITVEKSEGTKSESLEVSETFWPSYRSSSLRGIYIPLSFHLSGTYGGESSGSGVYSSRYMTMADTYETNMGKAVLAGTNYKPLGGYSGVRIFGSNSRPSWSGWGNGKWGHYGKG